MAFPEITIAMRPVNAILPVRSICGVPDDDGTAEEWGEIAATLVPISEDAVSNYRRIAAEAPEAWKPLAESMVAHEDLILTATRMAAEGEDEKAADLVANHLCICCPSHRPFGRPTIR